MLIASNIRAIKKRNLSSQYLFDYKLFVDRYSHVSALLDIVTTQKKTVVNVHGISGIGITHLLQFTADIINKKVPILRRLKYWKSIYSIIKHNYVAVYINISKISDIQSLSETLYSCLFVDNPKDIGNINENQLIDLIELKYKKTNLVFFLDEVISKEQMYVVDDFFTQYFSVRAKDTFIIGSHKKNISYQITYKHLEIQKLCEKELMVLAKVYKINLNPSESIELYELSDGIPLYAYLLLRYYESDGGLCKEGLVSYLTDEIFHKLSNDEFTVLSYISLVSISESRISLNQLSDIYTSFSFEQIENLYLKGLIQLDGSKNHFTVYKIVAEEVLKNLYTHNSNLYNIVFEYYIKQNNIYAALRYVPFLKNISSKQRKLFIDNVNKCLDEKKLALLYNILMPSIDLSLPVYKNVPSIYKIYSYATIAVLLSCGEYMQAKKYLDSLEFDGIILKTIVQPLSDDDFKLFFMYADAEHLLNNYDSAIDIIDSLILNSNQYKSIDRLPQLYWMKAHCLRHQWKKPSESLETYILCQGISEKLNQPEYVIRSLHGQICIALIQGKDDFDYFNAFKQLDIIYSKIEPNRFEQYKYNTIKYKAIFERINNDNDKALELLNQSLNGFISIKRRNIYDLYFEFGEYYRFNGNFKESYEYYEKSKEFAKENGDYNLESLSRIGIILLNLLSTNNHDIIDMRNELVKIKINCQKKELYLNSKYASFILDSINSKNMMELRGLCIFNP